MYLYFGNFYPMLNFESILSNEVPSTDASEEFRQSILAEGAGRYGQVPGGRSSPVSGFWHRGRHRILSRSPAGFSVHGKPYPCSFVLRSHLLTSDTRVHPKTISTRLHSSKKKRKKSRVGSVPIIYFLNHVVV